MNSKPILLFGMPRSGTTWIGKILDSHPDTLYRHEPDSWGLLNDIPLLASTVDAKQYSEIINGFIESIPQMNQTKVSATLPIFRKNYYSPSQFLFRSMNIMSSKMLARIFGEVSMPLLVNFQDKTDIRLVWKSIESLGRIGLIVRVIEECRGVHLLRHPCGYISSVLRGESKKKFTSAVPSSEDYNLLQMLLRTEQAQMHGLTIEKLKQMTPVERLAWRWLLFNEKAYDDTQEMKNCTIALYENFCNDPEGSTRRLFEFSGLNWHPQVASFLANSTTSNNSSYYSVFKDPKNAANKWRTELSSGEISAIMHIVAKSKVGQLYLKNE